MGITISSKRFSADLGYAGFQRFRNIVAEKISKEFHEHYISMDTPTVMFLSGEKRIKFFTEYDKITKVFVEQKEIPIEIANFLYQSDCQGKIDEKQAMQIFKLIENCDDNISFGYSGRIDCAKMSDFKKIFSDKTKIEWC